MRASFFVGLGLLGAAAMVDGCSVSTASTPPDNDIGSFCADYAKALCQVSMSCQFDSTETMQCTTFQTSACSTKYGAQVTTMRLYNQPNGKACIDKLNSSYTSGSIDAQTLRDIDTACNKVVIGNQQTNQPCVTDNDCSGTSSVCTSYNGMTLCGPATMKTVGQPCADPGDQCTGDSYCKQPMTGAPVCTATPAIGGDCSATIPCGASAQCMGGKCAARGTMGSSCVTSDDCTSDLYCDPYPPASCTSQILFGRKGADCNGVLGTNEPDGGGMVIAQPEAGSTETGSSMPEGGDGAMTSSEGGD
ncbi:MAG: hypothetical protein ACRENE_15190 [Polyangiaceae bacterium]